MAQRLAGKLAIVTGAASGIGKATCLKFANEGAIVVLVDINKEGLEIAFQLLTKNHKLDHFQACGDVSDSKFSKQLFTDINAKYGRPGDILVNCAGIGQDFAFAESAEEDDNKVIRVNLKSVFVMTKEFISSLKTEDGMKSASIINISSILGKSPLMPVHAVYAAAKAGMIGFTKTLGFDLGKYGVRCNSILPGCINTPLNEYMTKEDFEMMHERTPLKRLGTVEEVANTCLFLASDESSYITCASIEVTGGLLA